MKTPILATLCLCLAVPSAIAPKATAQEKQGGVIRLEETIIEGRVQKPNAFFINTRQALVYEAMTLKESFVREITEAAKKDIF